jgi:hypothetical protein
MDLPGGTKGLGTNRDAPEPGARRQPVSRDIEGGAALSAGTSTNCAGSAKDPIEWPRTNVKSNAARMKPFRRAAIRARTVTEISSSDWK